MYGPDLANIHHRAFGAHADACAHENVLVDTAAIPDRLAVLGVLASVEPSFGGEALPDGLVAVIGRRA